MPRKTAEVAATTKSAAKRTVTRRKKTEATDAIVLTWEHVAERAYYIHIEEGGDAHENWLRAEHELLVAA